MLTEREYNTLLQQYRAPPFRFKTKKVGDEIWVITSRDGDVTIWPNDLDGFRLCLSITNKTMKWTRPRLASLPFLVPIQGSFGESVHSFAHTPENVLAVATTFRMLRKREMSAEQLAKLASAWFKPLPGSEKPRCRTLLGEI